MKDPFRWKKQAKFDCLPLYFWVEPQIFGVVNLKTPREWTYVTIGGV